MSLTNTFSGFVHDILSDGHTEVFQNAETMLGSNIGPPWGPSYLNAPYINQFTGLLLNVYST